MSVEAWHRSSAPVPEPGVSQTGRASYGVTLALTATAALAACLLLIGAMLLVVHPPGSGYIAKVVIGQNQRAKTAIYLASFAVILPLALVAMPRLADRIAVGPSGPALRGVSALLVIALSGGAGRGQAARAAVRWSTASGCCSPASRRRRRSPPQCSRAPPGPARGRRSSASAPTRGALSALAALLAFAAVLCVTRLKSLSVLGLVPSALAAAAAVVLAYGRVSLPQLGPLPGRAASTSAVIVLLVLAIPDVVVYTSSSALPNTYFGPGVIQYQQDWILGSVNQLLGGGALLVNVPVLPVRRRRVYFLCRLVSPGPDRLRHVRAARRAAHRALTYAGGLRVPTDRRRRPPAGGACDRASRSCVLIYDLHYLRRRAA